MHGVIMGQPALARDGFYNRNAATGRKFGNCLLRAGITHAAARDDQRLFRRFQQINRLRQCLPVRPGARD